MQMSSTTNGYRRSRKICVEILRGIAKKKGDQPAVSTPRGSRKEGFILTKEFGDFDTDCERENSDRRTRHDIRDHQGR